MQGNIQINDVIKASELEWIPALTPADQNAYCIWDYFEMDGTYKGDDYYGIGLGVSGIKLVSGTRYSNMVDADES